MMQFAQMFPDIQIVSPLVSKLSWSHFLIVMPLKDELQREFYLTMAASERWSKRTLQAKIDGMLFERTAIATKPDELIKKELSTLRDDHVMSPDLRTQRTLHREPLTGGGDKEAVRKYWI